MRLCSHRKARCFPSYPDREYTIPAPPALQFAAQHPEFAARHRLLRLCPPALPSAYSLRRAPALFRGSNLCFSTLAFFRKQAGCALPCPKPPSPPPLFWRSSSAFPFSSSSSPVLSTASARDIPPMPHPSSSALFKPFGLPAFLLQQRFCRRKLLHLLCILLAHCRQFGNISTAARFCLRLHLLLQAAPAARPSFQLVALLFQRCSAQPRFAPQTAFHSHRAAPCLGAVLFLCSARCCASTICCSAAVILLIPAFCPTSKSTPWSYSAWAIPQLFSPFSICFGHLAAALLRLGQLPSASALLTIRIPAFASSSFLVCLLPNLFQANFPPFIRQNFQPRFGHPRSNRGILLSQSHPALFAPLDAHHTHPYKLLDKNFPAEHMRHNRASCCPFICLFHKIIWLFQNPINLIFQAA